MRIGKRWNVKWRGLLIPEISASPTSVVQQHPTSTLFPGPRICTLCSSWRCAYRASSTVVEVGNSTALGRGLRSASFSFRKGISSHSHSP